MVETFQFFFSCHANASFHLEPSIIIFVELAKTWKIGMGLLTEMVAFQTDTKKEKKGKKYFWSFFTVASWTFVVINLSMMLKTN